MTVTSTWTDPSEGGTLDRDSGQTIREQDWDALLSNFLFLGGTTGQLPRLNLLTNGGFEQWQRGAGAFTASSAYTADRWQLYTAGLTVTRETTTVYNGAYSLKLVSSGSAPFLIGQSLEGPTAFNSRTLSFSALAWAATASSVRIAIQYNGTTTTYSSYHTGNSTWQTLTVSVTLSGGLTAVVAFIAVDISGTTAYIDNATVTVGSPATDYSPLHPMDDMARCQRYYEVKTLTASLAIGLVQGSGTTAITNLMVPFSTTKAATPTITSTASWTVQVGSGGSAAVTPSYTAQVSHFLFGGAATVVNGTGYQLLPNGGSITAESNP